MSNVISNSYFSNPTFLSRALRRAADADQGAQTHEAYRTLLRVRSKSVWADSGTTRATSLEFIEMQNRFQLPLRDVERIIGILPVFRRICEFLDSGFLGRIAEG